MIEQDRVSGISIVCVFNDIDVRQDCLDRSIDAYKGSVAVDYIPVDNTSHEFTSAGAALNHGARLARHDVIVFVHQDVYLHSLDRIAQAATTMAGDAWGILGANGVANDGRSVGRLRDRVQLIGANSPDPSEVDSLDEVLFLVRRDRVLREPLSEDPQLAWHAYAVEYGLRLRSKGLRVGAVNLAITHNSLTINLDKLDVAHRRVAQLHPNLLPVATTCGLVAANTPRWKKVGALRRHSWRVRWLRESAAARKVSGQISVPVVLADIRHDIDLLDYSDAAPLHLFNYDNSGGFAEYETERLEVLRRNRPVFCRSTRNYDDLESEIARMPASSSWLVTDISLEHLRGFHGIIDKDSCIAGVQGNAIWLAGGSIIKVLPEQWRAPRAVPLRPRISGRTVAFQS